MARFTLSNRRIPVRCLEKSAVTPDLHDKQGRASDGQSFESERIRRYYDQVYHAGAVSTVKIARHHRQLAARLGPWDGRRILDIACGSGMWLRAVAALGAKPTGVDISKVALDVCRKELPDAALHCGPAEKLPFGDAQFDFISCLGALEHFLDPEGALREMIRVARPEARFLLLVPNADFPPLRMGIYGGTAQSSVREEVRSLDGWQDLFESVGFRVVRRWRDLHVLSLSWVTQGPWLLWPARLGLALVLPIWPLRWQYQVYHYCRLK